MSINDSIQNSVGLTDKNIKFFISDNGDFNEWVTMGHNQHQVLCYRATLMTVPEHCPQCGWACGYFFGPKSTQIEAMTIF